MDAIEFRLYATPVSVYSCKVRLALVLKDLEWTEMAPWGGYGSAAYQAIVAQGTVPALVHNGFILAESDAIIEYLDDIGAGRPLLPVDPRERARARALSRFIDTRLEPAARALFAHVGTGQRVPDDAKALLARYLTVLQELAGPGPYLTGATPALPDCGLWAVAKVLEMLEHELHLGLPAPALAGSATQVACLERVLTAHAIALQDWAAERGYKE